MKCHLSQLRLLSKLFECFFFFNVYLFILKERVFEQGRGTEMGRERIPSRLCAVSTEPDAGLDLTNHEIMT